ncbi:MAG TPA: alanine racemase [Polyangiaceae bacterium]|nr:alanine racemase [Polyangiaceae bacterium]
MSDHDSTPTPTPTPTPVRDAPVGAGAAAPRVDAHPTWVEIDRAALVHNARALRAWVAPAALMAVVKGNAYGHGQREVSDALRGEVDWFGVNSLAEAELLRAEGHDGPVLILGHTPPAGADAVVRGGFRQVLYDEAGVEALAAAAERRGRAALVHLEIETGTNRLGVRPASAAALAAAVRARPALALEGAYAHFANVEDSLDDSFAERQLGRFREAVAEVERGGPLRLKHAAATAASVLYARTRFDLVRAGIGLYGLWPSAVTERAAREAGLALELRPVLAWKARVAHVNDVPLGETVGYGCAYYASQPRRVATLPVGYYEGFDRGLSGLGPEGGGVVLVGGRPAPVVGRVAMNMCMVDVTRVPGVRVGDEVVLIGRQGEARASAEAMAERLGTINYEVVTRIAASVPRVVV